MMITGKTKLMATTHINNLSQKDCLYQLSHPPCLEDLIHFKQGKFKRAQLLYR